MGEVGVFDRAEADAFGDRLAIFCGEKRFGAGIVVLADDVQPNDLTVSAKGFVYFTETPKGQVTGIDVKEGKVFTAATKLNAPNGIACN